MTRAQIIRTAVLSGIIVAITVALDYLVNVVLAPGLTPYTPIATITITLLVAPAFTGYLIVQNAKVQRALLALAEERVARLEADGANAAKTQFLANMSHELRTPLNAIIGYAEMIEEDGEERVAADSQRILRSARHLLGLINEILDHARLEAGELQLRQAMAPLAPIFNAVAESIRATAAANGAALELDCPADIGSAWVDEARLEQCMANLASNAAKFTKGGRIALTMRSIGRDHVQFEVVDTGIGMSEQTLARLFRPFAQADGSITRAHGGAGLGLAITKRLLDSMGGSVSVKSAYGVGSSFTIMFAREKPGLRAIAA